ncbi:hypothetical protein ACFQ0K_00730 [Nocardioides caeni]|uniref:YfhO family protein n=1 Tax=Nocardioides caeni TaxID=574700 RepID=A0A4V4HLK2_9ACTN|nr:hypothetical protein [Nocardioides caeni]THV18596.1 hypothetical protein E9934_03020 [Nocardioides caeni]
MAVAVAICGPLLLGSGFWLVGDMVFVPHQPWKAAWLGLDGALPRAVPMDALVSLVSLVLPGTLVQKLLLLGGFLAGGLGIARLVGDQAWYARAAAITLFCWNPWVHERLLIGQWAILLGYLLLPWVAAGAIRLRKEPRDWSRAGLALGLSAVCSPSSGVMAAVVVLVLGARRTPGTWWRPALLAVVANLTWLVPALTVETVRVSTDGVFAGFAARAESGAGAVASVLSMGGIWKTSILPVERASTALVLLSCLLSAAALAGLWLAEPARHRWLLLGGGSVLVALVPTLPGGAAALEALGDAVPGIALLRDSHRFLAPLGLVLAVGVAHAVTLVRARIAPGTGALWSAVALLVVAPVLLLPSLAWGALGELDRSTYPDAWDEVADRIGDDEATVVLPWHGSYRSYDWNHDRAVLDPAPRYLPGTVLVDDRVFLDDIVVAAEDPRVRAVDDALAAGDPGTVAQHLRDLGVRWVLVEQGVSDVPAPRGEVAYAGDGLELLDLAVADGAAGEVAVGTKVLWPDRGVLRSILVTIAHLLAIVLISSSTVWILRASK